MADGLIVGSAIVRRLAEAINRPRAEVVREIGQFVAPAGAGRNADGFRLNSRYWCAGRAIGLSQVPTSRRMDFSIPERMRRSWPIRDS